MFVLVYTGQNTTILEITYHGSFMLFQPNTNEYLLKNNKKSVYAGNHGFDNEVEDMRSIFVAKGPSKYHDN